MVGSVLATHSGYWNTIFLLMLYNQKVMNNCVKKTFDTEEQAEARKLEINQENKKVVHSTELRVYKCRNCQKFHLTSMSVKEFNKRYDTTDGNLSH